MSKEIREAIKDLRKNKQGKYMNLPYNLRDTFSDNDEELPRLGIYVGSSSVLLEDVICLILEHLGMDVVRNYTKYQLETKKLKK